MDDLERRVGYAFGQVDVRMRARMHEILSQMGVTVDEWSVLAYLFMRARPHTPEMPHGEELMLELDGVALVMRRLRESGYVTCSTDRLDPDCAALTREGQRLVQGMLALNMSVVTDCTNGMTDTELELLAGLLERMARSLEPTPRS